MKRNIQHELKLLLFFVLFLLTSQTLVKKSLHEMNSVYVKNKGDSIFQKFSFDSQYRFKAVQPGCTNVQGWLKYLQISEDSNGVPSAFIKNKMFLVQMNQNPKLNTRIKDQEGNYINIPNDESFWVTLTGNELKISTSRNQKLAQCENKLFIRDIVKQDQTTPCQGGVENMGNFAEGYCFMVKFIVDGKHHLWELCTETELQKDEWMQCLISKKKKIDQQNVLGGLINAAENKNNCDELPNPKECEDNNNSQINVQVVHAGFPLRRSVLIKSGWVPEGDWSDCSKTCGSGIQTRRLKCIKPNRNCQGPSKEERACNLQKCKQAIDEHLENLKKVADGQWEYLGKWSPCSKPCGGGVQTIQRRCISQSGCQGQNFEEKPCNPNACSEQSFQKQSFSPCENLEGNLSLNGLVDSHVIVNPHHLDIFTDHLMVHPAYHFSLPQIVRMIVVKKGNNSCLEIQDELGKSTDLCGRQESECEKWRKRIEEMKNKCNNMKLAEFTNSLSDSSDPSSTLSSLSQQVIEEEKRVGQIKEAKLMGQFDQFKKQIQDLMDKEDKYERNLENQEKERIAQERENMRDLINDEQKRANDLVSQLEQLGKGDGFSAKQRAIKRKMKTMMDDIQKKINQKRANLINRLSRMKKLHAMEQRMAAKKLLDIKRNVGKKLANMNKKGNPNQCFITKSQAQIDDYCNCNYKDLLMNKECRNKSQFCYMCCDNELGKLNKENLDCCYNKCDKIASEKCDSFAQTYHVGLLLPHHHHHLLHAHPLVHHHAHAHHMLINKGGRVHHVIHGHHPVEHILHGDHVDEVSDEHIDLFP